MKAKSIIGFLFIATVVLSCSDMLKEQGASDSTKVKIDSVPLVKADTVKIDSLKKDTIK